MQRLLIADGSELFACALQDALGSAFEIQICTDGCDTLALLEEYQPDVLVLDFHLPRKDGITILRQATYRPAIILGLANYISPYLCQMAAALNITHLMNSPTVEAVAACVQDLICRPVSPTETELVDLVRFYLQILKFRTKLRGYDQLCAGLPMYIADPHIPLNKVLYPAIAQITGSTSGDAVEHSIRHAIENAWKRREHAVWSRYFPVDANGHIPCPSNGEFMDAIRRQILQTAP